MPFGSSGLEAIGLQAILEDSNFQAGLARYERGISQMESSTDRGASILSRLGSIAGGAVVLGIGALTAAVGATIGIIKTSVDTTLAYSQDLERLQKQFGLSGPDASAFDVAMQHVGLSVDEGSFGLNFFTRGLAAMTGAEAKATAANEKASAKRTAATEKDIVEQQKLEEAVTKATERVQLAQDRLATAKKPTLAMEIGLKDAQRSLSDAEGALDRFNAKLGTTSTAAAAVKLSPFAKALQELGVSAFDSQGKLKDFNTIVPEIMDAFQKLPQGVEASNLAMELFGARGGTRFLEFLREGSAGLEKAKLMAHALGLEMSTDEVNAAKELSFSLNDLQLGLTGMKNVIGVELLPVVKDGVDWVNANLIPQMILIAETVGPPLAQFLRDLGTVAGDFFTLLESESALSKFAGDITSLGKTFDLLDKKEKAIKTFAEDIGKLANKFGLDGDIIQSVVENLTQGVLDLWAAWQKGGIDEVLNQLVRDIQRAAPTITGWLRTWGYHFWDWLTLDVLPQVGNRIEQLATFIAQWLAHEAPGIARAAGNWAMGFWNWVTQDVLPKVGDKLGQVLTAIRNWVAQNGPAVGAAFQKIGSQFWDWITTDALPKAGDKLGELIEGIKKWIKDNGPAVGSAFAGFGEHFWDWITGPTSPGATAGKALANLLDGINAWVTSPEGKGAIRGVGSTVGTAIADAIIGFFDTDEKKKKETAGAFGDWLGRVIADVISIADTLAGEFAKGFLVAIVNGILKAAGQQQLTEEQKKKLAEGFQGIGDAINSAVTGGMSKITFPLPKLDISPNWSQFFAGLVTAANKAATDLETSLQLVSQLLPHSLADTGPLSIAPNYDALFSGLLVSATNAQTALPPILAQITHAIADGVSQWMGTLNLLLIYVDMTWIPTLQKLPSQVADIFNNVFIYFNSILPTFYSYGLDFADQIAAGITAGIPAIQAAAAAAAAAAASGGIGPPPQRPPLGYQHGGWVPSDMLARLHAGEYVIPASQTRQWFNNSRTIMPGAVIFQIQGGSSLSEQQLENVAYRVVSRVMDGA